MTAGKGHAPQTLLAACLLASMMLHGLVLVLFPGWMQPVVNSPAPALEVVMKTAETPVVVAEPLPVAPAPVIQRRRTESRQRMVPVPRTDPPVPIAVVPTAVETPAAPVIVASEPSRAVEPQTPLARAEPVSTPPLFNASYLRNPAPAYPVAARRRGDQGTVLLKVMVDPEGLPVRVELDQSSGSRPLDHAALDAVRGWRFVPARRGTLNVEGWVRVPVVFRLES